MANFVGNPGENSYAVPEHCGQGLGVNDTLSINGQTDLSDIIRFNDGGCVYGIRLTCSPGLYEYVLEVDAQGPQGPFSGSGHLKFTDESGDTYNLSIFSSRRSTHTVAYNSCSPTIILVHWNNYC